MTDHESNDDRSARRNRIPSWVFALAGGAAYLLLGVLLWWALDHYIKPGDSTERKDLVQALSLIMAGVAGAGGVYFTWRGQRITQEDQKENQQYTLQQLEQARDQLQLAQTSQEENQKNTQAELDITRRGQITERFTRAIDQLGNDRSEVRIGGIYALASIASDSDAYYWPAIEILCAYIRERSPWPPQGDYECGEVSQAEKELTHQHRLPDIQAILYILRELEEGKRSNGVGERKYISLTNTDLRNADLRGAHLVWARLRGANLKGARLYRAHLRIARLRNAIFEEAKLRGAELQGADLEQAVLCKADFRSANLARADLERADFRGANLQGANLQGALLREANLQGAKVTDEQLAATRSLQGATMPDGSKHP